MPPRPPRHPELVEGSRGKWRRDDAGVFESAMLFLAGRGFFVASRPSRFLDKLGMTEGGATPGPDSIGQTTLHGPLWSAIQGVDPLHQLHRFDRVGEGAGGLAPGFHAIDKVPVFVPEAEPVSFP